jgi:hypothetical protein
MVAPAAAAAITVEGLAGWEGDGFGQGYGFVGAGAVKPMGMHGTLVTRLSASYLYYSFESSGTTTSVVAPGVSALTGLRLGFARGSAAVLGGYEVRWEDRRFDAAPDKSGVTGGGVVQADADLGVGRRWRGFVFANYAGAARYLFSRVAVRWQATNLAWKAPVAFFVGVEGIGQGNDESVAAQGGVFLEWTFVPQRLSLALRGGYKDSWSPNGPHRRGAYGGLSVYHRF